MIIYQGFFCFTFRLEPGDLKKRIVTWSQPHVFLPKRETYERKTGPWISHLSKVPSVKMEWWTLSFRGKSLRERKNWKRILIGQFVKNLVCFLSRKIEKLSLVNGYIMPHGCSWKIIWEDRLNIHTTDKFPKELIWEIGSTLFLFFKSQHFPCLFPQMNNRPAWKDLWSQERQRMIEMWSWELEVSSSTFFQDSLT